MKVYRYIQKVGLEALLIGWGCLLTDCSDQEDITYGQSGMPLSVSAMTRDGGEETPDPMKEESVWLYLKSMKESVADISGNVTYWGRGMQDEESTLEVKPGADYLVFGFMPSGVANGPHSVNVDGNTVTMTIRDMDIMTTEDVCVVIGVNGKPDAPVKGSFKYHAPEDTELGYGVSLLVDHLYAAAEFQFKVGSTYNALRTIKLKKVEMKRTGSSSNKVNATLTLNMNTTQTNPLSVPEYSSVDGSGSGDDAKITLYQSDDSDGEALSVTDALVIPSYFSLDYASQLSLVSTYDVYDKQGHKIREDEKAENRLSGVLMAMTRGEKKIVTITVNPTYLYVLSDDDTPVFVIN